MPKELSLCHKLKFVILNSLQPASDYLIQRSSTMGCKTSEFGVKNSFPFDPALGPSYVPSAHQPQSLVFYR